MSRASVRHFPGHQAGASLKPGTVAWTVAGDGLLPRPPSRGLIEASHLSRPAAQLGQHFPGHQAGASLKLRPPRFPWRPWPDFPGHQAGASLKQLERLPFRVKHPLTSPATKPGPH